MLVIAIASALVIVRGYEGPTREMGTPLVQPCARVARYLK